MIPIFLTVAFTLAAAAGIAVVQLLLKVVSRWKRLFGANSQNMSSRLFHREDFLFWSEWSVSAIAAWAFFVVRDVLDGGSINGIAVIGVLIVGFIGTLPFPLASGAILYKEDGGLTDKNWRLAVVNLTGLAFLVAAVAVGVRVYG